MVEDSRVVADGAEVSSPAPTPVSGRAIWASIALLLTGIMALIVFSSGADSPTAVDDTAVLERPRGPEADEIRLGAVVSGLSDAFVGLSWTDDGELRRVLWPNSRGAVIGNLDIGVGGEGAGTAFDASGLFVAVAGTDSETGAPTLLVGRHTSLAPAAGAITSLAWHDTEPGTLAFTTETDEGTSLWRAIGHFPPVEITGAAPEGWQVAAWGEWGYAMQGGDEVVLLTPSAEVKASRPGRVLGSSRDGWILVESGGLDLVSAGGGVQSMGIAGDRMGTFTSASFSPDGEAVAIVGTEGILISPLQGTGETIELNGTGINQVVWSTDARFLFAAMDRGIIVFDLGTVNHYQILDDYAFQSLALIPSE